MSEQQTSEPDIEEAEPKDVWATTTVNVRTGPGTQHPRAGTLTPGTRVTVNGSTDGWLRLLDGTFVSAKYVTDTAPQPAPVTQAAAPAAAGTPPRDPIVRAPVVVHVAPGAQGTGKSADDPAGTIEAAQKAMVNLGGKTTDVDVVFAPGTYELPGTTWWTPSPGNRVRFLPADWTGGACPTNQPTFTGTGGDAYWLNIEAIDGATRFEVACMTVTNYPNGLRVSGGYEYHEPGRPARGKGAALPSPSITGMTFTRIGTSHAGWAPGFAAIHLQNTDNAHVAGNTLTNIRNSSKPGNMHAIYAVYSTNLAITGNRIDGVSGDAIRTRSSSTGRVWGNTATGAPKAVSDWWCDASCAAKNGQSIESPSTITHD